VSRSDDRLAATTPETRASCTMAPTWNVRETG
jgi:hypothetical protein